MRTGARLFLTRSYQSVGVSDLCSEAAVQRGSFYYFFASKADLARAVVDYHSEIFLDRLDRAEGASPLDKLRAFADVVSSTQAAYETRFGRIVGCPFGNLASELSSTDETLRRHLARVFAEIESRVRELSREAVESGSLASGVDADRFAREFMVQFQGSILLAKVNRWPSSVVADALHRLIDRERPNT